MESLAGTNHRVRFKAFELDLQTRELHRNGIRLRVQGQPIDVLEMLLERPGELVTREQLRKKLWPEHTFVDFEHSLNSTIARLREALGDHAEDPKFIETLPRLGYRFIATTDIHRASTVGNVAHASTALLTEVTPYSGVMPQVATSQVGFSTGPKHWTWLSGRRWLWILVLGLFAAIGTLIWKVWFSVPPTLVVTTIEPLTHDGLPKYNPKNDGIRIYFVERVNGRDLLSQVSARAGQISHVSSTFADTMLGDVSPDGSKLLVSEPTWNEVPWQFWILPLPSGPARRLGALEGNYAVWSPDGKRLIFTKSSEIWTADSDGSNPRKVFAASGFPWYVQISPDGESIRYSLSSRGTSKLWESRSDGSAAHPLLPSWHASLAHAGGVWSSDGKYYAFIESQGDLNNIWVLPETRNLWSSRWTNSVPVQLTHGPLSFQFLSFSPDGRYLFARGDLLRGELARYDPGTRQVSRYLSGISAGELAFSRDGQWIAFISYPDLSLWRCRIDHGDCQQLTMGYGAALPRWSPDGKSIAFVKNRLGKPDKIATISMYGGNANDVDQDERSECNPNWSPDGSKLIFDAYLFGDAGSWEIREADLGTHKVMPIPGSKGLYNPRWSPDGRYLVALTADTRRLMLFDFGKELWTTWITVQDVNSRQLANPIWSGDGHVLYLETLPIRGIGDLEEWRTRLGQHSLEKMLDLHDEPRYLGGAGPASGVVEHCWSRRWRLFHARSELVRDLRPSPEMRNGRN